MSSALRISTCGCTSCKATARTSYLAAPPPDGYAAALAKQRGESPTVKIDPLDGYQIALSKRRASQRDASARGMR
jgi:hypothetical protein